MRKRTLVIDLDDSREEGLQLMIQSACIAGDEIEAKRVDLKEDIIPDMALLCEAICTMIHSAHQAKIKPSHKSLQDCINHLEQGFADEKYQAYMEGAKRKPSSKHYLCDGDKVYVETTTNGIEYFILSYEESIPEWILVPFTDDSFLNPIEDEKGVVNAESFSSYGYDLIRKL